MIYGIGVDILRVSRVEESWQRFGGRFSERILHPDEQRAFADAKKPESFLAKSFAAKEAFAKALGTGFRDLAHDEVGLRRNDAGKPSLVFSDRLQERLRTLGISATHVSLSDDADLVCAMVVLETSSAS